MKILKCAAMLSILFVPFSVEAIDFKKIFAGILLGSQVEQASSYSFCNKTPDRLLLTVQWTAKRDDFKAYVLHSDQCVHEAHTPKAVQVCPESVPFKGFTEYLISTCPHPLCTELEDKSRGAKWDIFKKKDGALGFTHHENSNLRGSEKTKSEHYGMHRRPGYIPHEDMMR
ncbi:hypothetical protein KBC04_02775 [Candidatus Babeliales bacterium]|nr:hypothetical protein [Candidatus Babeliales bacterium]MBP9844023.1 hypothetical protein [Candidatus Babeliales bacterium]